MIQQVKMYGIKCNNCGTDWIDEENGIDVFGDELGILNEVRNDEDWHTEGKIPNEKHYCPDCFVINDMDELVINMTRTVPLDWEIKSQVATGLPSSTSLDGCPFHYCDSNPKCEEKCRYAT